MTANEKPTGKASFVVYHQWFEILQPLTDKDMGKLFRAMFTYQMTGNIPTLEPRLEMAFTFIKHRFDEDRKKYLQKVEVNRKAAEKRWKSDK